MSMITELVERLKDFANEYVFTDTDTMGALNDAAFVIEELSAKLQAANMERSSQYYNGGWIPVSERLPEVGSEVLVCYDFKGKRSVYIANFYGDGEFHGFDDEYLTSEGRKYRKAIAWMPLPQPYKAESEDNDHEVEVVTRGNCMICGKELTEGLFFCKECEDKASSRK